MRFGIAPVPLIKLAWRYSGAVRSSACVALPTNALPCAGSGVGPEIAGGDQVVRLNTCAYYRGQRTDQEASSLLIDSGAAMAGETRATLREDRDLRPLPQGREIGQRLSISARRDCISFGNGLPSSIPYVNCARPGTGGLACSASVSRQHSVTGDRSVGAYLGASHHGITTT